MSAWAARARPPATRAGGAVAGLVVGRVAMWVFRHLEDTLLDILVSILAGFAAYIAAEAQTAKPSTLGRRVAAIRYAHKLAGIQTPTDAEG